MSGHADRTVPIRQHDLDGADLLPMPSHSRRLAPRSCVQLKGFTPPPLETNSVMNYLETVYVGVLRL